MITTARQLTVMRCYLRVLFVEIRSTAVHWRESVYQTLLIYAKYVTGHVATQRQNN